MYVVLFVHIYKQTPDGVYKYLHPYMFMYLKIYTCMYTLTDSGQRLLLHTYIHTYIYVHIHIHMHIYINRQRMAFATTYSIHIGVHLHIYVHIHTHMHIYINRQRTASATTWGNWTQENGHCWTRGKNTYAYIRICTCFYILETAISWNCHILKLPYPETASTETSACWKVAYIKPLTCRNPSAGLKLTYRGGSQCDGSTDRSTHYHFECDPSVSQSCSHVRAYIHVIHTCMHTHAHTYIHTYIHTGGCRKASSCLRRLRIGCAMENSICVHNVHTYIHVIHTCIHTHTHMHTYIHTGGYRKASSCLRRLRIRCAMENIICVPRTDLIFLGNGIYVCVCVYVFICACVHLCLQGWVCMCMCVAFLVFWLCVFVCVAMRACVRACPWGNFLEMVYVHICDALCICICVSMRHVCGCICAQSHMYAPYTCRPTCRYCYGCFQSVISTTVSRKALLLL